MSRTGDVDPDLLFGRVGNLHRVKERLDVLMQPTRPWVLHDLRRSCASGMARLGVALPVTERVLNHQSGSFAGIVKVYQVFDYAGEKREALQRWGDHVERVVAGAVS